MRVALLVVAGLAGCSFLPLASEPASAVAAGDVGTYHFDCPTAGSCASKSNTTVNLEAEGQDCQVQVDLGQCTPIPLPSGLFSCKCKGKTKLTTGSECAGLDIEDTDWSQIP